MQIVIRGVLFQCNFSASLIFGLQKVFFDLKLVKEMSLITNWGTNWWQNIILIHNSTLFVEYLTPKECSEKKLTIFTPMFYIIKSLIFNQSFSGVLLIHIFVENHQ